MHRSNSLVILFIFICIRSFVWTLPEEPQFTYYNLYDAGKLAYKEERWFECAAFMRRALEDYKFYRGIIWNCHQRCERHVVTDPFPVDSQVFRDEKKAIFGQNGVPEARILEKFVKKALCLRRCKHDRLPGRPVDAPVAGIEKDFRRLQPYSYAQFCFWKLDDLEHAVSAAYTFLVRNPGDKMMSDNLAYYINEKRFKQSMVKDLEQPEYEASYLDGLAAYDEHRYIDVIDKMERSLERYFEDYEKCRALCDAAATTETKIPSDFYSAVTASFIQVLQCRSECESDLTVIRGNLMTDFVPSHFHYLQFAYWKESSVRKAAECVATFLVFTPEDETMLHNKHYYLNNYNLKIDHFVPRLEIVRYYKRLLLEKRLLDFMTEKFPLEGEEPPKNHPDDYRDLPDDLPGFEDDELTDLLGRTKEKHRNDVSRIVDVMDSMNLPPAPLRNRKGDDGIVISKMEVASPFWTPSNEVLDKYEAAHGVKVVKKETELSGRYRFLADNVLSDEECKSLLELAKLAEIGDGYDGQVSPHTKHEVFSGLTVLRVAELASQGKASADSAKLLLDKSELARDLVETYFNLTSHLYFDYTHLVCRSAKESVEGDAPALLRSDLSHAIHGDNCVFKEGRCDKRYPAYTWRDYSAVIYLNGDFTGGEFIFSDMNKDIQAEIRPKCGQMVAFSADTLHGVRAITSGSRCVIALWLTLDSSHEELERIRAQQMIAQLEFSDASGLD